MIKSYILIALFIAALQGAAPVIHKHVLQRIPPRTVIIISSVFYFSCIILFSIYNWKDVSSDLKKVSREDVAWLAFTASVTGFFAHFLYYRILEKHDSHIIAALIYSSPVFTLFFLHFFWGGHITPFEALGIFCTTIGIACISLFGGNDREEFMNLSTLL